MLDSLTHRGFIVGSGETLVPPRPEDPASADALRNLRLPPEMLDIGVPTHVLWGDSDRIFTPGYGRAYAQALGDGRFELIAQAGHLPQLEKPAETFAAIDRFVAAP